MAHDRGPINRAPREVVTVKALVRAKNKVKADKVKAEKVKADKVRADKVKADKVRADKVKADNNLTRPTQIRTNRTQPLGKTNRAAQVRVKIGEEVARPGVATCRVT